MAFGDKEIVVAKDEATLEGSAQHNSDDAMVELIRLSQSPEVISLFSEDESGIESKDLSNNEAFQDILSRMHEASLDSDIQAISVGVTGGALGYQRKVYENASNALKRGIEQGNFDIFENNNRGPLDKGFVEGVSEKADDFAKLANNLKHIGIAVTAGVAAYNIANAPEGETLTQIEKEVVTNSASIITGVITTAAVGALLPATLAAVAGAAVGGLVAWTLTRQDENGDALIDSVVDDINSALAPISEALDDVFGQLSDFINNDLANWDPFGLSPDADDLPTFDQAERKGSPIVIDLDGDGLETLSREAGVHFDHDGNGLAEKSGWVAADDGLLVRDLNDNDQIDGGRELFGDQTRLTDGSRAANGFEALAELDSNGDGRVDAEEADQQGIRIWRDANGDGKAQADELLSFAEAGLASVAVDYRDVTQTDGQGNDIRQRGEAQTESGETRDAADIWFSVDPQDTQALDDLPLSDTVAALPDVPAFGNVLDLRQAMMRDATLESLVQQFVDADSDAARQALLEPLIYQWTGAADTDPNSRDEYGSVYMDARKVVALEALVGRGYDSGQGGNYVQGPQAASILEAQFARFESFVKGQLLMRGEFREVFDTLTPTIKFDNDSLHLALDTDAFKAALRERIDVGQGDIVVDILKALRGADNYSEPLRGVADDLSMDDVLATWLTRAITTGTDGDDAIEGTQGSDWLDGREGDDRLEGGAGDDTYHYDLGDGSDILYDTGGQDTLAFGADIAPDDLTVTRDATTLFLDLPDGAGGMSTLRLDRVFDFDGNLRDTAIERFTFADGSTLKVAQLIERIDQSATEADDQFYGFGGDDTFSGLDGDDWIGGGAGNDNLYGGKGDDTLQGAAGDDDLQGGLGADVVQGGEGDDRLEGDAGDDVLEGGDGSDQLAGGDGADRLYGNDGNDRLQGGLGDDRLYGENGDDVLEGGAGTDTLYGGEGSDTYLFERGSDRIRDRGDYYDYRSATDVIAFGEGIAPSEIAASRSGDDLILTRAGSDDRIEVDYYFRDDGDSRYAVETIRFADGTEWSVADVKTKVQVASEGDDELYGYDIDETLNGLGGDDLIRGHGGNDDLQGGAGNDRLDGGAGDDIYRFGRGDGNDTIYDADYIDRYSASHRDSLLFESGLSAADLVYQRSGDDLVFYIKGSGDSVTVDDWFDGAWNQLQAVEFSDGGALDLAMVEEQAAKTVLGGSGADRLHGAETDNILLGLDGNDWLYGKVGNDVLEGGIGNDRLYGGVGDDTYRYAVGDGMDVINDIGGNDVLEFGVGIMLDDLVVMRHSTSLYLVFPGLSQEESMGVILVNELFDADGTVSESSIETFSFADGTQLTLEELLEAKRTHTATQAADLLYGNEADDVLDALGGDDFLSTGAGNDTLSGGGGNDTLYGGAGDDILIGGTGNDWLVGGHGSDVYRFGLGWGSDTVLANVPNDVDASDTIIFGEGISPSEIDTLNYDGTLVLQRGNRDDTIEVKGYFGAKGSSNYPIESILFSDGTEWSVSDVKARYLRTYPSDGDDTIFGFASPDVIDGRLGDDTLFGYDGDDTLHGDGGDDTLFGGSGADRLLGGLGSDTLFGDNGADRLLGGLGSDTLFGGEGVDTLHGDADNDTLFGEQGDDTLFGDDGEDELYGGYGNDDLIGGNGNDDLYGDEGDDTLDGGEGSDYLYGGNGNNELIGGEGNDSLYSGADDDALDGGAGSDELYAGGGDDVLLGGLGDDQLYGGDGSDTLKGDEGNDFFFAGNGDDTLWGGAGDDRMIGGDGNDTLEGGDGDDVLKGEGGDDYLKGGYGSDTYRFERGWGSDRLYECGHSQNYRESVDVIEFGESIVFSSIRATRSGDDLILKLEGTDDRLEVDYYFRDEGNSRYGVELIRFADGTNWAVKDVNEKVLDGEALSNSQQIGEGVSTVGVSEPSTLELA